MYVYVYICMYVCVYVYICIYVCMCVYTSLFLLSPVGALAMGLGKGSNTHVIKGGGIQACISPTDGVTRWIDFIRGWTSDQGCLGNDKSIVASPFIPI